MGGPLVGPNAQLFPKMHFEGPPYLMIKVREVELFKEVKIANEVKIVKEVKIANEVSNSF